jgi:prolyl-tRNA editing enzyme YbaK/EbsC (Cys-tRNA(Pro) deacylase)
MEIPKQLIECLDANKVSYEILRHPEAVTAQRTAQAEHVKGRHHAKVVMVKSGDQHLMMVLPADHQIDLEKLENAIGNAVSLDQEKEFKSLFPDCAIGAMPPLAIFMVCQRMWTRAWRSKTTSCSKRARMRTRSKWVTAITRKS